VRIDSLNKSTRGWYSFTHLLISF